MVSGGRMSATDVVWPPMEKTVAWLGKGPWKKTGDNLEVSFFEGGLVGQWAVKERRAFLERGRLNVPILVVFDHLEHLLRQWLANVIASQGAETFRSGDIEDLPPIHKSFVRAKRRRLATADRAILADTPRCVRCALNTSAPWKNRMRWMLAQTLVAAGKATASVDRLEAVAVAAMERRGDGKTRIKEFRAAVRRAKGGNIIRIPCKKRTYQNDGLWCPLNGDVDRCAAERGISAPTNPTPADLWRR